MRNHLALVCSPDAAITEAVTTALVAAGHEVICARDAAEARAWLDGQRFDVVLVDVPRVPGSMTLLCDASAEVPTLALAPTEDLGLLVRIVCHTGVSNIVAIPADSGRPIDTGEIVVTLDKILCDDAFGLDKYLSGDEVEMVERTITAAAQRDDELADLEIYLREASTPRHIARSIMTAADELITNAVYNAPRNPDGSARYAAVDRRNKIVLADDEHVRLRYGVDGRCFGISVTDEFGGFTLERLRDCLQRCSEHGDQIEHKEGGAGLGMYIVARTARQLVVNVDPDRRTEVIALWDLGETRRKGAVPPLHSLHYFGTALELGDSLAARGDGIVSGVIDVDAEAATTTRMRLRNAAGTHAPQAPLVEVDLGDDDDADDSKTTVPLWGLIEDLGRGDTIVD